MGAASLSSSVQSLIQRLRGYAAIATGDPRAGDAALARALERLLAEHVGFSAEASFDFKSFLFKLVDEEIETDGSSEMQSRKKVFVLTEIEGLTAHQTSQILGIDLARVQRWMQAIERN